jgi:cytochrome c biogenesis protein ResB
MKFAVWILVLAAAMSLLALLAGEMLPAGTAGSPIYQLLGLADPFRSWWFRLMLGVLALSLFVCVIERAPILFKQAFMRTFRENSGQMEGMPGFTHLTVADGEQTAMKLLRRLGMSVKRMETPAGIALSGVSGGLSRLGPLLNHFGMLLLIIGGLVISVTATSTRITGVPGAVIIQPEWNFQLRIDDFKILYYPVRLNMWVEAEGGRRGRVEQISGKSPNDSALIMFAEHPGHDLTQWYPVSRLHTDFMVENEGGLSPFQGNVKSYVTTATVIRNGQELYQRSIAVNSPMREQGWRFYQSSFQSNPATTAADSVILLCKTESGEATVRLRIGGNQVNLPWNGLAAAVLEFYPDFRLDKDMKPFSASADLNNPAARVLLFEDGNQIGSSWAFGGGSGHMGGDNLPVAFSLSDIAGMHSAAGGFATILEVNKDSGTPVVWAGFIIMTLGLMLSYTMTQRQAWALVVKRGDNRFDLYLAGAGSRDPEHFHQVWERAVGELSVKRNEPSAD